MSAAELAFEYLLNALEATRGTAITTPDNYLALDGMINPKMTIYSPEESNGTLAANYRSSALRRWVEWEASGALDPNKAHRWMAMALNGGSIAPTTPGTGVKNWVFPRAMTTDDIKSATMWWGDPGAQIFRSAQCMVEEFSIDMDGGGTGAVTCKIKGSGQQETKVSAPTLPGIIAATSLLPAVSDIYLEANATNAFGTTSITSRALKTSLKIQTGVTFKFGPQGTGAAQPYSFRRTGRKRSKVTLEVEMELLDVTQYDIFNTQNGAPVRLRVVHNAPTVITGAFYPYVMYDVTGPLTDLSWGDFENSNRTVKFKVPCLYDATLASDLRVTVQNTQTTL